MELLVLPSVTTHVDCFWLPVECWSSLSKAIRVVACVSRFCHNARFPSECLMSEVLSQDELG